MHNPRGTVFQSISQGRAQLRAVVSGGPSLHVKRKGARRKKGGRSGLSPLRKPSMPMSGISPFSPGNGSNGSGAGSPSGFGGDDGSNSGGGDGNGEARLYGNYKTPGLTRMLKHQHEMAEAQAVGDRLFSALLALDAIGIKTALSEALALPGKMQHAISIVGTQVRIKLATTSDEDDEEEEDDEYSDEYDDDDEGGGGRQQPRQGCGAREVAAFSSNVLLDAQVVVDAVTCFATGDFAKLASCTLLASQLGLLGGGEAGEGGAVVRSTLARLQAARELDERAGRLVAALRGGLEGAMGAANSEAAAAGGADDDDEEEEEEEEEEEYDDDDVEDEEEEERGSTGQLWSTLQQTVQAGYDLVARLDALPLEIPLASVAAEHACVPRQRMALILALLGAGAAARLGARCIRAAVQQRAAARETRRGRRAMANAARSVAEAVSAKKQAVDAAEKHRAAAESRAASAHAAAKKADERAAHAAAEAATAAKAQLEAEHARDEAQRRAREASQAEAAAGRGKRDAEVAAEAMLAEARGEMAQARTQLQEARNEAAQAKSRAVAEENRCERAETRAEAAAAARKEAEAKAAEALQAKVSAEERANRAAADAATHKSEAVSSRRAIPLRLRFPRACTQQLLAHQTTLAPCHLCTAGGTGARARRRGRLAPQRGGGGTLAKG